MFIAHRYVERAVLSHLAEVGFEDLTLAQARVLQRIAEGGIRLTALAEQAQITKQSAGFLVDQLERAGYLERVPDPADARARLIRMAARGRSAVEASLEVVDGIELQWSAHLGVRRMAHLREALVLLREITDPYLP